MDVFEKKRLLKFIELFRRKNGHPPTLKDFEQENFDRKTIDSAVREKILEQFYATLSNGTIVKTYKPMG